MTADLMRASDLMKANEAASVVFGRSIGGYNRDQVDDFLDRVADSLQNYAELLIEADQKTAVLEEQVAQFGSLKNSFQEALSLARQGGGASSSAEAGSREAETLLADARIKAQAIVAQAQDQVARLADQVRSLTTRRDELLSQGRILVARFNEVLGDAQGEVR